MTSPGPLRAKCPENSLPCRNSTSCYRRLWACDGIRDCPLADDELGCYQGSNRTAEKEPTARGGGGGTPYSIELGFLIFVMAGGLLFLLFLWWLCNISVHRRGQRRMGCMEALVADLKDRTWKSDLYDPDEFSEDNVRRSLRGEAAMEEGQQPGPLLYNHRRPYRLAERTSSRCSESLRDHLLSVDEMGMLGSPHHRPPTRPQVLNISRPPSYNSCLNAGGNAASVVIRDVRRGGNVTGDVIQDAVKAERPSVSEEDGSGDLLPSYDEVTREAAEPGSHPERLPKYPPAYCEVIERE